MVVLLFYEKLELKLDGVVWVDGVSIQGICNWDKILKQVVKGKVIVIIVVDFKKVVFFFYIGCKWVVFYQVVYIYFNIIDKVGEQEEEKVFCCIEEEFEYIIELFIKIVNINGNNVLIMADYGYLYQYIFIVESDFFNVKV